MDRKKAKVVELQQLTGLLNFFHRAIVPGRAFTRRMYNNISNKCSNKVLLNHHHISLTKGFVSDCKVWESFLTSAATNQRLLCHPFIDLNEIVQVECLNFTTDASAKSSLGMGGIFNNRWIVMKWGEHFINSVKPSIKFLELYALTAGILTWSKLLQNCCIMIKCDNQAVMHMVNNLTSKCPQCMKLIKLLTLDGIVSNRRVFVVYVVSVTTKQYKNDNIANFV